MEYTLYPASSSVDVLRGVTEIDNVTTPAAGSEWSFTCTGGYYRRLLSGTARLVTSAVVANRFLNLGVTDGQNLLFRGECINGIAASNTVIACYSPFTVAQGFVGAKNTMAVPFPSVWLPPGYVIQSSTGSIDVADQYSQIVLWFECIERQTLEQYAPDLTLAITEG